MGLTLRKSNILTMIHANFAQTKKLLTFTYSFFAQLADLLDYYYKKDFTEQQTRSSKLTWTSSMSSSSQEMFKTMKRKHWPPNLLVPTNTFSTSTTTQAIQILK